MTDRGNAQGVFIFAAWFASLYFCAGGGSAGCAYIGRQLYEDEVRYESEVERYRTYIIVAAKELEPGTVIAETDLYAVEIHPRSLSDGVFLSPDPVVSRKVRETILANEFVRSERLEP